MRARCQKDQGDQSDQGPPGYLVVGYPAKVDIRSIPKDESLGNSLVEHCLYTDEPLNIHISTCKGINNLDHTVFYRKGIGVGL